MKKLLILALLFSGCAKYAWIKPTGTEDEKSDVAFAKARGTCLAQAYQAVPETGTDCGRAIKSNTACFDQQSLLTQTRDKVFSACMNGQGWVLEKQN